MGVTETLNAYPSYIIAYLSLIHCLSPDNNLAERSLRLAVTKRKVSGGSRSMSRFEQTADLLSVIQTCRFQGKSAMTFFRDAISAHSCDLFMPSLIPQSKTCILTVIVKLGATT